MKPLYEILFWLAIWWGGLVFFALISEFSKDNRALRREFRNHPPTGPSYGFRQPAPTWAECKSDPSMLLVMAIYMLMGVLLFILCWPKLFIHWLLYSRFAKR